MDERCYCVDWHYDTWAEGSIREKEITYYQKDGLKICDTCNKVIMKQEGDDTFPELVDITHCKSKWGNA